MHSVKFDWAVRALNPKNERDKKSISHASAGIGYYILSTPEAGRQYYVVGYKHFGGELNTGSEWANRWQVERLNQMDARRYS